ncbi:MAG TPA: hypothetical protein VNT30_09775 [Stellaceae bacterium]|nr:hypothetical protein [Stellaceae bacterium]
MSTFNLEIACMVLAIAVVYLGARLLVTYRGLGMLVLAIGILGGGAGIGQFKGKMMSARTLGFGSVAEAREMRVPVLDTAQQRRVAYLEAQNAAVRRWSQAR